MFNELRNYINYLRYKIANCEDAELVKEMQDELAEAKKYEENLTAY